MPRQQWLDRTMRGSRRGNIDKRLVAEDEERRLVCANSLGFAPFPELAQNGERRPAKQMAAFDAPDGVPIGLAFASGFGDQPRAGLFVPIEAAPGLQLSSQLIGDGLEMVSIIPRVAFHALGERTHCPVRFLGAFLEFYS